MTVRPPNDTQARSVRRTLWPEVAGVRLPALANHEAREMWKERRRDRLKQL